MPSIANGFIIGHIGGDPRISTTANAKNVANFNLAVQDYDKSKGKDSPTTWYSISAWGVAFQQATNFKSGDLVFVQLDRPVSLREYETKEGEKKTVLTARTFMAIKMQWFKAEGGEPAPEVGF